MKKLFRGTLIVVIVATLFSYSVVLSATNNSLEDILEDITDEGKIFQYILVDKGDNSLGGYENFVYKFKENNIKKYYNSSNSCIKINDVDYKFTITYLDESNKEVVICNSAKISLDSANNYYVNVLSKPEGEATYNFSLVSASDDSVVATYTVNANISKDENVLRIESDDSGMLKRILSEILCFIMLPTGDSYLHMISLAIGEVVTIDRIVYGEVGKIDVDFFESGDESSSTISKPIKNILSGTINTWYSVFRNIVLVFYMGTLVYFGIKILLTSTANKKAVYKGILMAWIMGIAMLMFFPYVMKYAIKLNYAFCKAIQGNDNPKESIPITTSLSDGSSSYGKDKFVMMMLGKTEDNEEDFRKNAVLNGYFNGDTMMYIRFVADHTANVPLAIVYLIMIGEVLALLVMYYKRVFMLAFLITIFPIAMALYPFSKTGDVKMNVFGVWFKEFIVNVFVQSFHAVTYVVVVSAAVTSYAKEPSKGDWLFMIICILFLFEGEKIIRGIFNAKSSINSIGDLAASGMLAMNMVRNITEFMPKIPGREQKNNDNANRKAANDRPTPVQPGPSTPGAQANANEINEISNTNNSSVALGRAQGVTVSSANMSLNDNVDNAKSKKVWANRIAGVVGGSANIFAQTVGTLNGFAMGMAQNDGRGPSGLEKGISSAIQGKSQGQLIGRGASNIITGAVGKVTAIKAGRELAREYSEGEHDDEIFTEADKQLDDIKKQALREAYAHAAKSRAAGFENSAEIKVIKERVKRSKK